MNCSVKFLSPIVTGGFPFPGFAAPGTVAGAEALLLLLLLLPQAATASARPATTTASMSLLMELHSLLFRGRSLLQLSDLHAHRPFDELRVARQLQSPRGHRALHQREPPFGEERE